ncbi:hypothetical protein HYC85_017731 [Camellia sinensis]|uniref:DUF7870 domain-containing protein n=1 Tax=Camellia sinensis TaxID=4442 RepID=A0A7J7GW25_CAMSI|nr:hypothetical protein HYC85_017731 [Camellia sinensis]
MELGSGHRSKREIETKRLKSETIGLNSDALLVIKLPTSQVLRVASRCLFLAFLILALPSIVSVMRGPPSSLFDYEAIGSDSYGFEFLPLLFHDLWDEGLLIEGDRALVVSSRVGNFMDYSEFLNENDIDLAIESDLESQSLIPDETFDFLFTLNYKVAKSVDRVIKIGGLLVMQLSNDPSNTFQQDSNYKIVYIRRFNNSTVVAMRKTGLMIESVNLPRKLQHCGSMVDAKKEVLKGLEDVLFEPPPRRALAKSSAYLEKPKFLPDLLQDSLESYKKRIFITDDSGGVVEWFNKNYPTRDQHFEVYNLEIDLHESMSTRMPKMIGMSDWFMENVREEDFVVMKAEERVVEEMMRKKTICLVDELFLECKNQWEGALEENEGKRAYWECLALYGRLRDEGVAVHQWWG